MTGPTRDDAYRWRSLSDDLDAEADRFKATAGTREDWQAIDELRVASRALWSAYAALAVQFDGPLVERGSPWVWNPAAAALDAWTTRHAPHDDPRDPAKVDELGEPLSWRAKRRAGDHAFNVRSWFRWLREDEPPRDAGFPG
jgi:hypothetical protein